jgi:Tfp pilus assembly protein PilX
MKKMLMPRKTHRQLDDQGFASIVIAFILIIVLALLTVGFAQLARREQKSALDKQLSTQAFYAAESGVNDTVQNLSSLRAAPPSKTTCLAGGPTTVGPSANGVQYTCVLVDLTPPNILYDNVQAEEDRYITSSTTAGANTITVNWGSTDGNNTFAGNATGGFTPASTWNASKHPAVLQFSLTPLNPPSSNLSRDSLANNTFTAYLYPVGNGAGSIAYSTVNQPGSTNGAIVSANCTVSNGAKYPCKATITGVPGGTGPYLFRVVDHYDPSNVNINGQDILGQQIGFDGQTQIDVTGKAHEVLRRIQVRVPTNASYKVPKDALEAQSACKHFTTDPVSGTQAVALSQDASGACDVP